MIRNYIRPQTEIFQVLEDTSNPLLDRMHAVVVGPAYRHADVEAGNLNYVQYQDSDVLPYTLVENDVVVSKGSEVVDQDNVALHARNLRIELFANKTGFILDPENPTGNVLVYNSADGFLNTEDPDPALDFDAGRAPTVGDVYKITDGATTIERRVVGLLGKDTDPAAAFSSYLGALAWPYSSAPANTATIVSANFTNGGVLAGDGGALSAAAQRYVRRYGKAGLGDQGGLRLNIVVQCTTAATGSDPATAVFQAIVNGSPLSVVGAIDSVTDTLFTIGGVLADIEFRVQAYLDWQVGDRINVTIDYSEEVIITDETVLDGGFDVSAYTYADSIKRVPSSIVVEPIAISDTDVVTFRISDTVGLMVPITVTSDGAAPLVTALDYDGSTVTLTIPTFSATAFHIGQKYAYLITPPGRSHTIFDKIVLNVPVGALSQLATLEVTGYVSFTGPIPAVEPILSETNFTVTEDNVTLETLQVSVPGYSSELNSVRNAVDGIGEVAVVWRGLLAVSLADGLVPIESEQDIIDTFYSTKLGSELGYGLKQALTGSQGKLIYGLNTGGTSVEAFAEAFAKLEAAVDIYALAILTTDEDVMKAAAAHCQAMSLPTVKRFRRCYVGTDSPGEYAILDLQDSGLPYTAQVQEGNSGLYNSVIFTCEVDNSIEVKRGDLFEISGSGERYVIQEVHSNTLPGAIESIALLLTTDVGFPIGETAVRILAADTPENTARYVWQRSTRLGGNIDQDRRIANIWQDGGRKEGIVIPNRFGACEIAGLRTALQPQQGLTRTEVTYIDSAPSMYTKFKPTLLDTMAANGVWIIAQNSSSGPCYVRHQLTTAVSNGSLYYEDNAGTNVDSVCFALDDIVEPLIGKRNATPNTVLEIKNLHIELLDSLTKDNGLTAIGSQIIAFFNLAGEDGTIDVAIDPNFKDRINEFIGIEIPLPLNNVRIVVQAQTIKQDGVFVNTIAVSQLAS